MINDDFHTLQEHIYDICHFKYTYPELEKESIEYSASTFKLNGLRIKSRHSKITPKKSGQFVTLWKRNPEGVTAAHDILDPVDLFIIHSRKDKSFGQFIFPKSTLSQYGIVSNNNTIGKRGFRVYPPWDKAISKQAQKTQKWQLEFFLEIHNEQTDLVRAKKLYQSPKNFQTDGCQ